jgi:hypothetical protein
MHSAYSRAAWILAALTIAGCASDAAAPEASGEDAGVAAAEVNLTDTADTEAPSVDVAATDASDVADDAALVDADAADVPAAPDVAGLADSDATAAKDAPDAPPMDVGFDAGDAALVCASALDCPSPGDSCQTAVCKPTGTCAVVLAADGTACDDGDPATGGDVCQAGWCVGKAKCGDGICNGSESAWNCLSDCGFLLNHTAGKCSKVWEWDECPYGFVCAYRPEAGGGPLCVADVHTWPAIPDAQPPETYVHIGAYCTNYSCPLVSRSTGLGWSAAYVDDDGGFVDWRAPTVAELTSIFDPTYASFAKLSPPFFMLATGIDANGGTWEFYPYGDEVSATGAPPQSGFGWKFRVRAGLTGLAGSGKRFGPTLGGKAIRDHLSGLTWRFQPGPAQDWGLSAALQWCQSQTGLPGAWRLARAGELMQLSTRDPRPAPDGFSFAFADGSTYLKSATTFSGGTWTEFVYLSGAMDPFGGSSAIACVQVGACDPSVNCSDGNDCTLDACDPATGCQHVTLNGSKCDDGTTSTTNDTCAASVCKGTSTCGNGVCDGIETAPSCPQDCGFLLGRIGSACSKVGQWDECPFGFICTAAGGGNVCVQDGETWAPLPDAATTGTFVGTAAYFLDTRTGLAWSNTVSDCSKASSGGYSDWRAPTLGEAETLAAIATCESTAPLDTPKAFWKVHTIDGFTFGEFNGCNAVVQSTGTPALSPCVRGGAQVTSGKGGRFWSFDQAPYANNSTIFDRLTGLTWRMYTLAGAKSEADAQALCAQVTAPVGAKWRVPTLGELRQVALRDPRPKPVDVPWVYPFKDWYAGSYLAAASQVLDQVGQPMWHFSFPLGTTDWNPNAPSASVPCVSP